MLRIRDEQLDVLKHDAVTGFVHRMAEFVMHDYPSIAQALGERGLEQLVRRAISLGAGHGIDTEAGVTAWLSLLVQYGEDLERSPDRAWAMKVLAHATLPASLKVEMLVERLGQRSQGRIVVLQGES